MNYHRIFLTASCAVMVFLFTGCNHLRRQAPEKPGVDLKSDKVGIPNDSFFAKLKPYFADGYTVRMRPKGTSMLPTINDATDMVRLQHKDTINVWDVVLAEIEPGHYVLHRVMRITDGQLILRGDNNRTIELAKVSNVCATLVGLEHGVVSDIQPEVCVDVDDSVSYIVNPSIRLDHMGEVSFVVDQQQKLIDMARSLSWNESAEVIWHRVSEGRFTVADMVQALQAVYDVPSETAAADCRDVLSTWLWLDLVKQAPAESPLILP